MIREGWMCFYVYATDILMQHLACYKTPANFFCAAEKESWFWFCLGMKEDSRNCRICGRGEEIAVSLLCRT